MDKDKLVEPDCFSFAELGDPQAFMREMKAVWGDKVESARFTIVSDEYPMPPYPHGLYFEGWSKAAWKLGGREAPFNYPLTAALRSHAKD